MSKKLLMVPTVLSLVFMLSGCALNLGMRNDVDLSFLEALESFGQEDTAQNEDENGGEDTEEYVLEEEVPLLDIEELITEEVDEEISLVTLENFNRLETGMTIDEVIEIIGDYDELTSDSEVLDSTIEVYTFTGDSILSSAMLTFTDGELTNKVQTGLE